ncbi:hypothetical protein [Amphibacillus cookii]|uniref:hypothetical protein n=1 Tax=Amphibacillus cookii TaxID=767787 RepID=UPI00195D84BF|nr:hypothetical protein [Amphibacillus cookii]MBM7542371.1 hypothetical protein [Amphibacillus cookii]
MGTIKKTTYIIVVISFFISGFLYNMETIKAHRLMIEIEKKGQLGVYFDDGTTASDATVSAFDESGQLIFEEQVDKNGQLTYDPALTIHRFIAEDNFGHRASTMEKDTHIVKEIPAFIRIMIGISCFTFIATFFSFRHQYKEAKEKNNEKRGETNNEKSFN